MPQMNSRASSEQVMRSYNMTRFRCTCLLVPVYLNIVSRLLATTKVSLFLSMTRKSSVLWMALIYSSLRNKHWSTPFKFVLKLRIQSCSLDTSTSSKWSTGCSSSINIFLKTSPFLTLLKTLPGSSAVDIPLAYTRISCLVMTMVSFSLKTASLMNWFLKESSTCSSSMRWMVRFNRKTSFLFLRMTMFFSRRLILMVASFWASQWGVMTCPEWRVAKPNCLPVLEMQKSWSSRKKTWVIYCQEVRARWMRA